MDHTVTLGSIIGIVTVLVSVAALYMHGRKVRRENEADAQKRTDEIKSAARQQTDELKGDIRVHNDSVEKRLNTLETKAVDFMPRAEIEAKIEHERRNRMTAQDSTVAALNRHSDKITALEVGVGKVEQKQDGMAADMSELKTLLRDFARDVNAKLDKQAECLNSISRRAA